MCFNGLARQIHPVTQGSLDKTFSLCGLMPNDWIDYCTNTIATAAFSVGDRELPFAICAKQTATGKENCFQQLVSNIRYYSRVESERWSLCAKIEDPIWRQNCSI
jgi:hypothetical protein